MPVYYNASMHFQHTTVCNFLGQDIPMQFQHTEKHAARYSMSFAGQRLCKISIPLINTLKHTSCLSMLI